MCFFLSALTMLFFFTQTFFHLRNELRSVKVEVHSVKLHHNELQTDQQKVFDYVSQYNKEMLILS